MPWSIRSHTGCPVYAVMVLVLSAMLIALLAVGATAAVTTAELSITCEQDIATVVSVSPDDPNLVILRLFRDTVLLTNPVGEFLWTAYAAVSPPIAEVLVEHEQLCRATRGLLLTPVVYLAALCVNMIALLAFLVLVLLVLVILLRYLRPILKGVLYGLLASLAGAVAVITLGALGYELPICAVVAAFLLPVIFPVGLAVCVITWIEYHTRPRQKPRLYYF